MENFFTVPVIWFLAGLALMLLELVIPGFVLFFFGVGAWLAALASLIFDFSLDVQIFIFLVGSLAALLLLRRHLVKAFKVKQMSGDQIDADEVFVGQLATTEEDLQPGVPGKVIFRGTQWTAETSDFIPQGKKVEIIKQESLLLFVKEINHKNQ